MAKFRLISYLAIIGGLLALPASANAEAGRYSMTPTKDGILRLDTRTGAVSLCSRSTGKWKCEGIEGENRSLEEQVKRLEDENERLRSQLDAAKLAPAPRDDGKLEIPSQEDVDKAMDFMEKLLNRFKGMVEHLNKDKKEEDGVPL